jgi:effector-binding domain-containing protein
MSFYDKLYESWNRLLNNQIENHDDLIQAIYDLYYKDDFTKDQLINLLNFTEEDVLEALGEVEE